jgi:hypothetical protein
MILAMQNIYPKSEKSNDSLRVPRVLRRRIRVAAILSALGLWGMLAPGAVGKAGAEEPISEVCATCHEEESRQWKASGHSRSLNGVFQAEWERRGKAWQCLVCHVSQYDRKTGHFSQDGVSCESCHGVMTEEHPGEKQMVLPVDSQVCQSCHGMTWGEWRISAHGQGNIRCFDCHKMHDMGLRRNNPDEMCGSCHPKRLNDFAHATHRIEGLHCITCHMPEQAGVRTKIEGTGVREHMFSVGAKPCSDCHRETVHDGHEVATLESRVERLEGASGDDLHERIVALTTRAQDFKERLDANKKVIPWIVALSFLLGGFSGASVLWFVSRRGKRGEEDRPFEKQ